MKIYATCTSIIKDMYTFYEDNGFLKTLYQRYFLITRVNTQVPSSHVITSLCWYSSVSEAWKVCVYVNGGATAIGDV